MEGVCTLEVLARTYFGFPGNYCMLVKQYFILLGKMHLTYSESQTSKELPCGLRDTILNINQVQDFIQIYKVIVFLTHLF